jgi:hypothetical protein
MPELVRVNSDTLTGRDLGIGPVPINPFSDWGNTRASAGTFAPDISAISKWKLLPRPATVRSSSSHITLGDINDLLC